MVGRKKKQQQEAAPEGATLTPEPNIKEAPPVEPEGPMPPTYFGSSILALFLCTILGLPALYYGLQVRRRWSRGDEDGAFAASRNAEMFMYAAIGAFVIIAVIGIIWAIVNRVTSAT